MTKYHEPDDAKAYVKRIRNATKRQFAREYLEYLSGWRCEAPLRPDNLSVMACQAVRLALHDLVPQ